MKISSEGVKWLLQAGRLMQAKSSGAEPNRFQRRIVKADGETYPEAVLRELHSMPESLQAELFDAVDWAVEYAG